MRATRCPCGQLASFDYPCKVCGRSLHLSHGHLPDNDPNHFKEIEHEWFYTGGTHVPEDGPPLGGERCPYTHTHPKPFVDHIHLNDQLEPTRGYNMSESNQFVLDASAARALVTLLTFGGEVTDEGGFATRILAEAEPDLNLHRSKTLRSLEQHGFITRDTNAKRTYRIALTDSGIRSAEKLIPLIENGNDEVDLTEVDSSDLINEIEFRLNSKHECNAPELQAQIDAIVGAIESFDEGKSGWLQSIQDISDIVKS